MTTDDRTNEPNKYAGFLARQNHQRDSHLGLGVKCLCGRLFDLDADHALHQVEEIMRAALEAAAGVAPQAESAPTSKYISPHLPSMIRNLWKSDPSENSVRTALKLAGDLIQELIDLRAASVQPLSTVDEAALARVVRSALPYDVEVAPFRKSKTELHFRTVADGDLHVERITRAVAEYLTGGMK
ncbi:MAG: hypothetical protein WC829_19920 [Hyphomicrobium sp.]|jgi:hypothetical protein